jgi:type II secretory pathway pseudopilin PulG
VRRLQQQQQQQQQRLHRHLTTLKNRLLPNNNRSNKNPAQAPTNNRKYLSFSANAIVFFVV